MSIFLADKEYGSFWEHAFFFEDTHSVQPESSSMPGCRMAGIIGTPTKLGWNRTDGRLSRVGPHDDELCSHIDEVRYNVIVLVIVLVVTIVVSAVVIAATMFFEVCFGRRLCPTSCKTE